MQTHGGTVPIAAADSGTDKLIKLILGIGCLPSPLSLFSLTHLYNHPCFLHSSLFNHLLFIRPPKHTHSLTHTQIHMHTSLITTSTKSTDNICPSTLILQIIQWYFSSCCFLSILLPHILILKTPGSICHTIMYFLYITIIYMRIFFHTVSNSWFMLPPLVFNHIFHLLLFSPPSSPPFFSFFVSLGSTSQRSPTGTKPKITLDPYIRLKSDKLDLVSPGYFRATLLNMFSPGVWCRACLECFIQAVRQNQLLILSLE